MSDKPLPNIWPNVYANMLPRVREVARALGYAIGVHGSMVNDCDLIAVPWVDDTAPAELLADAIGNTLEGWTANGCPKTKPHGRLAWSFALDPTHYIDLSVFSKDVFTKQKLEDIDALFSEIDETEDERNDAIEKLAEARSQRDGLVEILEEHQWQNGKCVECEALWEKHPNHYNGCSLKAALDAAKEA